MYGKVIPLACYGESSLQAEAVSQLKHALLSAVSGLLTERSRPSTLHEGGEPGLLIVSFLTWREETFSWKRAAVSFSHLLTIARAP